MCCEYGKDRKKFHGAFVCTEYQSKSFLVHKKIKYSNQTEKDFLIIGCSSVFPNNHYNCCP